MSTLLVLLLSCYIAGSVLPLCVPHNSRAQNLLAHGLAGAASLLGIGLGLCGLVASKPLTLSLPSSIPHLEFAFRLDALAAFFILTISLVGLAVSVYAFGYVTKFYGRTSIGVLGALFNGFLLSMTLVVLADNGFFFLIVWELMSLLSYFLVVTEHEKPDVRYAGFFYLIMTHIGMACHHPNFFGLLSGYPLICVLSFRSPDTPLSGRPAHIGLLHRLNRIRHQSRHCPAPRVVALCPSCGSVTCIGVDVWCHDQDGDLWNGSRLFRSAGWPISLVVGVHILLVGAVSALLGVMYALMQHDLKSLLGFHSVENIGIILLGIGAGMVFHTYGLNEVAALGLLAGLYHTINHAAFKALLFMGAGSLLFATHTRNIEEYGGLLRRMPWTGFFFLIGALSIAALPPTNGFVSEWLVFQSLFLSFQLPSLFLKLMLPIAAAMLALTGALALVCFAKAFGISFLAQPRSRMRGAPLRCLYRCAPAWGRWRGAVSSWGLDAMLVVPLLDRITGPFTGAAISSQVLALDGWAWPR